MVMSGCPLDPGHNIIWGLVRDLNPGPLSYLGEKGGQVQVCPLTKKSEQSWIFHLLRIITIESSTFPGDGGLLLSFL